MNRSVFVGLLAVVVVAAAGVGAFDTGTGGGERVHGNGQASSVETAGGPAATTDSSATTGNGTTANGTTESTHATTPTYPPGTSADGITDPRELLDAHVAALTKSGFAIDSSANATVIETGMRLDATSEGGARVAPGVSAYRAYRTDAAGPLKRDTEGYYDGEEEYRRHVGEFGSVRESTRGVRSAAELAGRPLLGPHLRGGAFTLANHVRNGGGDLFVFTASGVENERAVEEGLPDGTTAVRFYEARVVIDSVGRIRSFTTRVGYVIGGKPATHHLEYDLSQVGGVSVEQPAWVEETTGNGSETGTETTVQIATAPSSDPNSRSAGSFAGS